MVEFNNDFKFNKNYVSRSNINKKWLEKNGLSNFSVKEAKKEFYNCEIIVKKTGNPYNEKQQRRTKYVSAYELKNMLVKGYNRSNKQK